MSKNTLPVNGGAMSATSRAAILSSAWAIFCQTYNYPRIKFSSIGRPCFAWALRQAWAEARAVQAPAPIDTSKRLAELQANIHFAGMTDNWSEASRQIAACRVEIGRLAGSEVQHRF